MTEPDKADRAAQTGHIYQALGHYFVEFSRLVSVMESSLIFAIGGEQRLLLAALIELTADPLARAWRSVVRQATDLSAKDLDVLSGLCVEISSLINLRNDWAHGTWFVGYGNEATTDWSQAALMRLKNSAKGVAPPSKLEGQPTATYIEKAAAHASVVADAVSVFGMFPVIGRLSKPTDARPSDRVRIVKVDGRRQISVTQDGVNWRSSEWV